MSMTTRCFYHSADLDGKCSAAIVKREHPDAILHPIDYGEEFPWNVIQPDDTVYVVDFSLQPWTEMVRLWGYLFEIGHLVWIDHHVTAIENYERWVDRPLGEILGLRRTGIGACLLVWGHLFPHEPVPMAVRLLAEYDVWDHSHPDCLPFQYGIRQEDTAPDSELWERLFTEHKTFYNVIARGRPVYAHVLHERVAKVEATWFPTELIVPPSSEAPDDGGDCYRLMAANAPCENSQLFDSVWDPEKYHAMCLFYWSGSLGQWRVGLYTSRDDVHCGRIAQRLGGGGHPQAAGFECYVLPFKRDRRPI